MAQRTRNHILEDKSRIAFNEIIPENWVVRDKGKDYGIDCEVEIFDDQGDPTGQIFYVQLKATESDKSYNIKNVSFETEKIAQFQSYSIPVVIVRYSHLEKKLYYTWANDIPAQKISGKNIIIKFSDNRILNQNNSITIWNYVIRFNIVLKGNFRFPITTYISKDIFSDESNLSAEQYFKKIILSKTNYFKFVRNESDAILQLKVGKSKVYLTFSDNQTSSIAFESDNLKEKSVSYFTDVTLACVSILLFKINKIELANEVFFKNDLIRILNLREDFMKHFLPYLLTGEYCERVINELEGLFDVSKDNTLQNLTLGILMASRLLNDERIIICQKFLEKQIEYSKLKNYTLGIATSNYNLGNFHRNLGNWRIALDYYFVAKNYKPNYKKQGYFYSDIAGVFFELGKYSIASKLYESAIQLNTDNKLAKAHWGDSLLHLGQYQNAVDKFDEFLTEQQQNSSIPKDELYLKYFCIHTLILNGYPTVQQRNTDKSLNSLIANNIDAAIDFDMLNGDAWYKNGIRANQNGDLIESFISFTMASLFKKENILYWVMATISGFTVEEEKHLHHFDLIRLAYRMHSESYIDLLFNYINKNLVEVQEPIMKMVEMLISEMENGSFSIRIFENESKYELINL